MVIACCDHQIMTLKSWIPKANQHIYEPKYICDKISEIPFIGFSDMVFTTFSGHCLL